MDARVPAWLPSWSRRTQDPGSKRPSQRLAAQDYEDLSVLVLVAVAPRTRPSGWPPSSPMPMSGASTRTGLRLASNQALGMVEGASFYLFCHDDCAPDPDAIHLLVEESYRSNAAVVSPKMVRWDDPRVLLHVGRNADKTVRSSNAWPRASGPRPARRRA